MLSYLAGLDDFWGPLRLFRYITIRGGFAGASSLIIGFIAAPYLFGWLRKMKLAQPQRDESEVGKLAEKHASKKDTPTMGGLLIYASVSISVFLWARPNIYVITAMLVYTGLTAIGFLDDYLKVTHKNSGGLSGRYKLLGQAVLTLIALTLLLVNDGSSGLIRELWVPFIKYPLIAVMPLGVLFIFFFLVLAGSSNAINLTDGVDGLAIGCTVSVALVYIVMSYAAGHAIIADYLLIRHIDGAGELAVVCSALVGASLAFLWYNAHPADAFMGDTGSLALGGLIGTIAFMVHQPVTLVIVGGIFVLEALSVIIQVASYKIRGVRVFLCSPIHHHFELLGWVESKLVIRFWILSLIFAISGLATLKLR